MTFGENNLEHGTYTVKRQDKRSAGVTWRALLVGILLIPVNVYWIMDSGGQGYPTTVSLYFNVIFCVFVLIGINFIRSVAICSGVIVRFSHRKIVSLFLLALCQIS